MQESCEGEKCAKGKRAAVVQKWEEWGKEVGRVWKGFEASWYGQAVTPNVKTEVSVQFSIR